MTRSIRTNDPGCFSGATLSDYVDYRTYLDYDIKVTNTVSGQQAYLSRVSRDSSGGENQAPFYVAICASHQKSVPLSVYLLSVLRPRNLRCQSLHIYLFILFHSIMTDDGSYGTKGVVTAALDELVAAGNQYDLVITIGPLIMMKFVVKTCQKHGLKSIVSMNPIMIDGTGMCGGCRLTVGGETKFACVDGPDFDGDLVDFDEAMARGTMYRPFEAKAREKACNLFKTEEAK